MTRDQIIDAFLIPLAWEKPGTVAASYKATTPFITYRVNDNGENLADDRFTLWGADNRYSMGRFPTLADAIAACEADHRSRAVKTWDIAKIEALVADVESIAATPDIEGYEPGMWAINRARSALATIRGRT